MDALTAVMLFPAGIAGGVIAGMVGGGSLVTFPAMLSIGVSPIVATASNIVALTLSNITAVFADQARLPHRDKSFLILIGYAVAGSAIGAILLLVTAEKLFTVGIPLLMGLGTALFAFSNNIRRWASSRATRVKPGSDYCSLHLLLVAATAVYGSYFGASFTVMLLAVLSFGSLGDFRSINMMKNLLAGLIGIVAIVFFGIQSSVASEPVIAFLPTIALTLGAVGGGYLGGWLPRVMSATLLRWIVIAIGVFLTLFYARKYWMI